MCGLCILNFDSNQNDFIKVYISHFSTLFENFGEILVEINNFIFKSVKFSEIIVNIFYKKIDGKFELVSNIKNAFKELLKFRWFNLKTLEMNVFL